MITTKSSPGKFAMNYGILLGVIMVLIAVIMYVTGMPLKGIQWPQYLYYLFFPLIIILGIKAYKAQNEGFLSLGEALKTGIAIALISGLIYVVYIILFNYVIDPEYNNKIIEMVRDQMLESPDISEAQVEQTMGFVKKMSDPVIGSSVWIGLSLFFGLIYSLIGGLVMKNENPLG